MKALINSLAVTAILITSVSTQSAAAMTDNQRVTQCRASVAAAIDGLERSKVSNIRSHRGVFQAKFKVVANGERSVVLCKQDSDQQIVVSCLKGDACGDGNAAIAAKK